MRGEYQWRRAHLRAPASLDDDEHEPDWHDYGPRIGFAVDDYLAELEARGRAPRTIRRYRSTLYALIDHVHGATLMADLAREDLRLYLDDRSVSASTRHWRDTVTRAWLRWCLKTERLRHDPLAGDARIETPRPQHDAPTPPEVSGETEERIRAFSWET